MFLFPLCLQTIGMLDFQQQQQIPPKFGDMH